MSEIAADPSSRLSRSPDTRTVLIVVSVALALIAAAAAAWLVPYLIANGSIGVIQEGLLSKGFWTAVAVGLAAQTVDGALGMAYGITSTSFLLSAGVPPAAASALVHVAEIFTTAFSGAAHWRLGNVNPALFKRLVIPGMIGGILGAYILTSIDGKVIKPYISAYLLIMGFYVLYKAFRTIRLRTEPPNAVIPLALTGGFVDAVGGGGWGPVVTTSLVGGGQDPRTTIGSVNAAEFFVTLSSGLSLTLLGGLTHWTTIAGLVLGGLFAAPFAAVLTRKLSSRVLMTIVGLLIIGLSVFNLYKVLV